LAGPAKKAAATRKGALLEDSCAQGLGEKERQEGLEKERNWGGCPFARERETQYKTNIARVSFLSKGRARFIKVAKKAGTTIWQRDGEGKPTLREANPSPTRRTMSSREEDQIEGEKVSKGSAGGKKRLERGKEGNKVPWRRQLDFNWVRGLSLQRNQGRKKKLEKKRSEPANRRKTTCGILKSNPKGGKKGFAIVNHRKSAGDPIQGEPKR